MEDRGATRNELRGTSQNRMRWPGEQAGMTALELPPLKPKAGLNTTAAYNVADFFKAPNSPHGRELDEIHAYVENPTGSIQAAFQQFLRTGGPPPKGVKSKWPASMHRVPPWAGICWKPTT